MSRGLRSTSTGSIRHSLASQVCDNDLTSAPAFVDSHFLNNLFWLYYFFGSGAGGGLIGVTSLFLDWSSLVNGIRGFGADGFGGAGGCVGFFSAIAFSISQG